MTVVVVFVLDGWGQPDLAVQASVVEPVDVLGGGDLEVVDALPGTIAADRETGRPPASARVCP